MTKESNMIKLEKKIKKLCDNFNNSNEDWEDYFLKGIKNLFLEVLDEIKGDFAKEMVGLSIFMVKGKTPKKSIDYQDGYPKGL